MLKLVHTKNSKNESVAKLITSTTALINNNNYLLAATAIAA